MENEEKDIRSDEDVTGQEAPAAEPSPEGKEQTQSADRKEGNQEETEEKAGEAPDTEEKAEEASGEEGEDAEGGEEKQEEAPAQETEEDESMKQKYLRLMADFQNYKRRNEKDRADVFQYANEKLVTALLQVMDNFERALAQECQDEAYKQGMDMIFKQLTDVLKKEGLEEIEAVGQDFDPNLHHAVLTDDNDEFESGQVTTVLQKGYKLNEKVIRPAMVRVNQ